MPPSKDERKSMFTTDHLEFARSFLAVALVLANVAVWIGVYFEGERFTEALKQVGWKILVVALAAEAAFAAVLVVLDSVISARQKAEILTLETIVGGRQLSDEQINQIAASLKSFAGKTILVGSYLGDAEGARLGLQVRKALKLADIEVSPGLGSVVSMGDAGFGIDVTGQEADKLMTQAIATALKDIGPLQEVTAHVTPPAKDTFPGVMIELRPL